MMFTETMKIDPHNHRAKFLKWKEQVADGIPGVYPQNSEQILRYISDMENGLNVAKKSAKGPRSFIRLNNLRQRLIFLAKLCEKHMRAPLTQLTEEQIITLFNGMRNGVITRLDGKPYRSVIDFINPFKAFWHWHMKVSRKKGVEIVDITQDLDTSKAKPRWVYLTEADVRRLCDQALPHHRVLILFLYDTGIRSPTELVNIRVRDLSDGCRKLHIRDEIAKGGSFGRRINLMLCAEMLVRHVRDHGLEGNDQLFPICASAVNRYLKNLAKRVLGDAESPAGEKYSNLTMYDFRHCSCCYWLPRYKSESALKYRFGWRKSDKIHYYSELLGMKDTICEEDMLVDVTKTEIERQIQATQRENVILREQIEGFNNEARELKSLVKTYLAKVQQAQPDMVYVQSPQRPQDRRLPPLMEDVSPRPPGDRTQ